MNFAKKKCVGNDFYYKNPIEINFTKKKKKHTLEMFFTIKIYWFLL